MEKKIMDIIMERMKAKMTQAELEEFERLDDERLDGAGFTPTTEDTEDE
jgi:hypothetical protein